MTDAPTSPWRAVVVDDEPLARQTLELLVAREADFVVTAACATGAEAIDVVNAQQPDVLFLDVQMPEVDGFDVIRHLDRDSTALIVFVTAYDQYALQAFEQHAFDYLLKPFSDERFALVVERIRHRLRERSQARIGSRLNDLLAQTAARPRRTLLVRDAGRTVVIPHDDIVWIEAEDYCAQAAPSHAKRAGPRIAEGARRSVARGRFRSGPSLGDRERRGDPIARARHLGRSAHQPGRRHLVESQPHAPRPSARGAGPAAVNARVAAESAVAPCSIPQLNVAILSPQRHPLDKETRACATNTMRTTWPTTCAFRRLTRRQFAAASMGAGLLVTLPRAADAQAVKESDVEVKTPDGVADCYFVHPGAASAGVIVWPDILGLRPAFRQMGKRLAESGYAVLVVNPFYRQKKAPVVPAGASFADPETRNAVMPLAQALNATTHTADAKAFVAFLDSQAAVDKKRKIGTTGYCMGGPIVMRTAAAAPDRIGAGASFHGGGLVTEESRQPAPADPDDEGAFPVCGSRERRSEGARGQERAPRRVRGGETSRRRSRSMPVPRTAGVPPTPPSTTRSRRSGRGRACSCSSRAPSHRA